MLDDRDRQIVNALQGGFSIAERPFLDAATALGLGEADLIARLERLTDAGVLSRFGPLYDIERLGGAVTLAAMAVPEARYDAVADLVNAYREVAHNYAREHRFNMWMVVSAESRARIDAVLDEIAARTGLSVLDLPKETEHFLELRLQA